MNEYDAVALSVAIFGSVLTVLALAKKAQPPIMRIGKFLIGVCCLSWGLLYFVDLAQAAMPRTFTSESEFLAAQDDLGFIPIGKFPASWPATYVDELAGEGGISFTRQDGTPHKYKGFKGYRLRAVRLIDAAGGEAIFVLRSKFKH